MRRSGPLPYQVHQQTRPEWIAALDKIDALKPSAVVAGHKIPTNDDSPRNVGETRQYIRDFSTVIYNEDDDTLNSSIVYRRKFQSMG